MRGKSIEPASFTLVAREVNLRIEVTVVNNNLSSCLGKRVACEVDLWNEIRLGEVVRTRELW